LGFLLKDFRDSITLRQGRDNAFIMFLTEEVKRSDKIALFKKHKILFADVKKSSYKFNTRLIFLLEYSLMIYSERLNLKDEEILSRKT
jgi:hypothetical protein